MSKPKLSPWFNVKTQPPVNGGDDAWYLWRCKAIAWPNGVPARKWTLRHRSACPSCQWHGVLK